MLSAACGGDDSTIGILDSGVRDTGGASDATPDTGAPDTGEFSCPSGRHLCGAGCVDDLANEPENGCRTGCGEACPTPALGVASCTAMGTCDFTCEPPSVRDGDTCACTAMTCEEQSLECGEQTDGCGMPLDCGACPGGSMCTDGVCGCMDDAAEENDNRFTAYGIGSYDDGGTSMTFDAFALSSTDDEDWFTADITDATNLSSSPDIDVTLSGIPMGADFDLAAWFVCDSGTEEVTCVPGAPDSMIGAGCSSSETGTMDEHVRLETNCTGTLDETGTLYVRVSSTTWDNSCAPYSLALTVD
jgi:hypothetical protein